MALAPSDAVAIVTFTILSVFLRILLGPAAM